jgi:electron transfer flavoprotein alpha subunit
MNNLVFIEQRDGHIKKPSFEAARAAATLAASAQATVTAVAIGGAIEGLQTLGGYGAGKVLHVADDRCKMYSTTAYAKALAAAAEQTAADVIFLPATAMGKDLAPRLAARLTAGVAADVTQLKFENGAIIATRPVYAGKALENVTVASPKKIFTLRPNVFNAGTSGGTDCPVETLAVEFADVDFTVKATAPPPFLQKNSTLPKPTASCRAAAVCKLRSIGISSRLLHRH